MKTISVTLSKALDAKLTSVAKQRRTTKSALVRAALTDYLTRNSEPQPGSVAALAKDLIGAASGGPIDLSYNKKHMEGFGRD